MSSRCQHLNVVKTVLVIFVARYLLPNTSFGWIKQASDGSRNEMQHTKIGWRASASRVMIFQTEGSFWWRRIGIRHTLAIQFCSPWLEINPIMVCRMLHTPKHRCTCMHALARSLQTHAHTLTRVDELSTKYMPPVNTNNTNTHPHTEYKIWPETVRWR